MPNLPAFADKDAVRLFLIAQRAIHRARQKYPWYDSVWFRRFSASAEFIRHARPERLGQFLEMLAPFRTRPDFSTRKIVDVLDAKSLAEVRERISSIPVDLLESAEVERFGRTVVHNLPYFLNIQKKITSLVSEIAGERVETSYNFLSQYSGFGVCEPHMDSPSAKWTLDLCVDQSRVWPIYLSEVVDWPEDFSPDDKDWRRSIVANRSLRFQEFNIEPGEAVVFSGSSQWHYRNPFPRVAERDFCNMLFFHFVPEGTREIVRPRNWPKMIGVAELEWVVEAEEFNRG